MRDIQRGRLYLAEMQEPCFHPMHNVIHHDVVVLGVFTTVELAKEAIEARTERRTDAEVISEWEYWSAVDPRPEEWYRTALWTAQAKDYDFEPQVCWQMVRPLEIDHRIDLS